ncbi:MAG: hypothetical protein K2I15_10245, partial [Bacteroides sp.]|nr:hypothetical protein [Bacteroides sp.]
MRNSFFVSCRDISLLQGTFFSMKNPASSFWGRRCGIILYIAFTIPAVFSRKHPVLHPNLSAVLRSRATYR